MELKDVPAVLAAYEALAAELRTREATDAERRLRAAMNEQVARNRKAIPDLIALAEALAQAIKEIRAVTHNEWSQLAEEPQP
jgi:thioester reductase-like protein